MVLKSRAECVRGELSWVVRNPWAGLQDRTDGNERHDLEEHRMLEEQTSRKVEAKKETVPGERLNLFEVDGRVLVTRHFGRVRHDTGNCHCILSGTKQIDSL